MKFMNKNDKIKCKVNHHKKGGLILFERRSPLVNLLIVGDTVESESFNRLIERFKFNYIIFFILDVIKCKPSD